MGGAAKAPPNGDSEMRMLVKPCPFCGSKNINCAGTSLDERYGYGYSVTISCNKCGVSMSEVNKTNHAGWNCEEPAETISRAILKWETRA